MQEKRSRTRLSFEGTPARWLRDLAVPTLPIFACFLGGSTEKWSEGIIIALLGVILLVDPPRSSLGLLFNLILLSIAGCAATAFLPARWFFSPVWREVLTSDFGINLPNTVSPQPFVSLECFVSLIAGLSWLYYVSALDLGLRDVRQQLRIFSYGVILLAALCLALYSAGSVLPFWQNQRGFGPFPNRNQTANLFGLSAVLILACGQDNIRCGRKSWIIWLAGFGLIVAAIVVDFSRAGIVILIAGITLWLGGFLLRKRSVAGIALGLSVLLILLTAMLIFGGQTFERFHLRTGYPGDVASDLRWAIFKDAFELIRASPWCGIGLGNFDAIFAIFRNASLTVSRTIHPESDWLWFWTEAGWLAIPLALAGMAVLIRRAFPLHEGTNQRFRLAALIAAILFALHGLIDVSAHRIGTAFSGMFFLGMALRRPTELPLSSWIPWLFRLIGVLIFCSGIVWVVATRYEMALPGSVGVEIELHKAATANQGHDFKDAIQRSTRAIEWAPLKWQLYFARAIGEVGARRPAVDALNDFRRARFLEPNAPEVPYQEGIVWLNGDPDLAIAAWKEALRRAGTQRLEMYGHMLTLATQRNQTVRQGLKKIGVASHDLTLVYLRGAAGADFKSALHDVFEQDPSLQTFSSEEKVRIFAIWRERGDPEEMARAVEAHPDWIRDAWRSIAHYNASRNRFRNAFEMVERFGITPVMPHIAEEKPIEQLQRDFQASPDNFGIGYELYRRQMETGRLDDALTTVRHFTERQDCPRYFYYLEAKAWAAKENWERAWKAWVASEADEQKKFP